MGPVLTSRASHVGAPASAYAGVTGEVLLLTGGRNLASCGRASREPAWALPRVRHAVLPGTGQVALTHAAVPRGGMVAEFLAAP